MTSSRCLVIAPNWVGDAVMALPVLDSLAASGREVHVLAKPHLASLLAASPAVASVLSRTADEEEALGAARELEATEAVVLPNSFRSAWLAYRSGAPRRWGYAGGWRRWMLRPAVPRPLTPRHQVDDYAELLAAMGVRETVPRIPVLPSSATRDARSEDALARAGLADAEELIGLFPGAEFGPSKRWPLDRLVAASRDLARSRPAARQVVLAGPKEVWLAVRLHERTGKVHPVVGPDLDLLELAGVLSRLDVLVTNDSGPMHLAAAVGVRCVVPFGPTDPDRTAPVGDGHEVLTLRRWCSPCFRRRCPLLHHRCLVGIESATAVAAVERVLASAPPPEGD